MTDRRRQRNRDWGQILHRGERRDTASTGPSDDEQELLPGIVIRNGRIGPGSRARQPSTWVELATFAVDAARLLMAVARDRRVPFSAKLVAGAAALYVVSPIDLVPDFIPVAGRIDDVYFVVRSLRYLAESAGHELLRELWTGSDDGFALLMGLTGVGD